MSKLSIKEETAAIDMGARLLWKDLDEEQRKALSFYVLNRYASSIKNGSREDKELAIFKTNEYLNKHFFALSKHPELQWYLTCMTGNDNKKIFFHEWIATKKTVSEGLSVFKFLKEQFPNKRDDEIELLIKINSKEMIAEYAESVGYDKKEIKKML